MTASLDKLPEEVILRIIEHATKDPDDWDDSNTTAIVALGTLCKSWHSPAIRHLYRDVHLTSAGQALSLYKTLSRPASLQQCNILRSLDTDDVFEHGPIHGLRDLIDLLPNLTQTSVYVHQLRAFSGLSQWKKLRHLVVYESREMDHRDQDWDLDLGSIVFPPALSTLHLYRCESLVAQIRPWSEVELPNVNYLIIKRIFASDFEPLPRLSDNVKILPRMPNLKMLEAESCCRDPNSEAMLLKMLRETSKNLRHLKITERSRTPPFLSPGILGLFKKLEILEATCSVREYEGQAMSEIFPSSLRWFDLTLSGGIAFVMRLLEGLSKPDFLPNLQACPMVLCSPGNGLNPADRQALTRLAISTYDKMIQSRTFTADAQLHLLDIAGSPSSYILCLPSPTLYRSALANPQRAVVDELVPPTH